MLDGVMQFADRAKVGMVSHIVFLVSTRASSVIPVLLLHAP
eukprot:COSAG01_NODE_56640_length_317_cov_0.678899_1_plen_40_part_01